MVLDLQHFITQQFIYDRGEVELLIVSGPEADDFLNRLSTRNFKIISNGSSHGAFLNGQGKLISIFTSWRNKSKNYFFIEKEMFSRTKDYLNKMHFSENLKIETEKYFCVEARKNVNFPSEIEVEAYNWGIPGKYFFSKNPNEVKSISDFAYDAVRAQFGFPKPLRDLTSDHILIEGPLDNFLDRNKGCYPGQEVIEKIYTYGRVARKIKKIIFNDATQGDIEVLSKNLPQEILVDGQNVGILTSVYSGENPVGIVTLKRHFYEKHSVLQIQTTEKRILNTSVIESN